jgi:hypothetical protein
MQKTERKLRPDLTDEQKAKAPRIGSLTFRSHRDANRMSHGAVEQYAGIGPKGRAA